MELAITWEGERAPFAKAFVAAQKATEAVKKASTNPAFRSKYADLSAVVEAVVPALNAAGIGVLQFPSSDGELVSVTTTFLHESGASVSSTLTMRPTKSDPQGVGSVTTYLRRYSLLAMTGAAPEDDDGQAASAPARRAATEPAPHTRAMLEASVAAIKGPLANDGTEAHGEDFPGVEPGKDKSAYFHRKDGGDKLFKEISAEIVTLESAGAVAAFLKKRLPTIETFPEGWRKQLREELEEQKQAIRDNTPADPDDEDEFPGDRPAPVARRGRVEVTA